MPRAELSLIPAEMHVEETWRFIPTKIRKMPSVWYQLGMPWHLRLFFIKASSNTCWSATTRQKGKLIFGAHIACGRRKRCSRKTSKDQETVNIMTLKTGEKFHTAIFTSSERKCVKIIIRMMIATCCNQEIEICSA